MPTISNPKPAMHAFAVQTGHANKIPQSIYRQASCYICFACHMPFGSFLVKSYCLTILGMHMSTVHKLTCPQAV